MVIGLKEILASLMAIASLVYAYRTWAQEPGVTVDAIKAEGGPDVPLIDLARLDKPRAVSSAPSRDLFAWGRSAQDLAPVPTPVIRLPPTPFPSETPVPIPTPIPDPTPTPWPLLNITLIGVVETSGGHKAASFVKDGEIVLVGQPGQVLANSFRVVSVSATSAEIEELGSSRVRRLPLKTN